MRRKQTEFNLFNGFRGGRRPNSGRKRIHSPGVAHRPRELVGRKTPLHINFKYRTYIRNKDCLRLLKRAIVNSRKMGLSVIHYSLQTNHIHLIVESASNDVLTRGMRSLTITFAKGLKSGKVQLQRYHLHVLKSVKEAKNAIRYVLFNQQKHESGRTSTIDDYSSVLSLPNAIELIRVFAMNARITLALHQGSVWKLAEARSYFAIKGIEALTKAP